MWNKNEREGHVDQAKGRVKQAVGDLTGNDKLRTEGKVDETVGKAKTAVGVAQKKVGAAIDSIGKTGKTSRNVEHAKVGRRRSAGRCFTA